MKCFNCGKEKEEVQEGNYYCDGCSDKVMKEYDEFYEKIGNFDYELNKDRVWRY